MMQLDEGQEQGAVIKVIGVGGAGGNAVNTMIEAGVEGVQFIVANTDKQALSNNLAEIRIQIGEQRTHGLGAGSTPAVGQEAAQESASIIQEHLKGANMVFVTAGMGGGTGTGAAPIIAGIARQLGALTVGVVTKPFKFEGRRRRRQAEEGIANLQKNVDTLITIPNERLLLTVGEQMTLVDAFREADSVLLNAVRSISELITKSGYVNTDFADVRTVMSNQGLALMGTGVGTGPNRAADAAEAAISSPLLDDVSLEGATSVLLNITAPRTVSLLEITSAASLIEEAAAEDVHLIWGQVFSDDEDSEEFKITIIATGFEQINSATGESGSDMQGMLKNNSSFTNRQVMGNMPSIAAVSQSGSYGMAARRDDVISASAGYYGSNQDDYQRLGDASTEIARKMQEIDAEVDNLYRPVAQTPSYMPASKNDYAEVDVFQQVQGPRASSAGTEAVPRQSASGITAAVRPVADHVAQVSNELDEESIENTPAFLRRSKNGRSFLDNL